MGIVRLYSGDMYVHDLDGAVDLYVGTLGFEKRAAEPVDGEGHRWVEVTPEGSETAIILAHGFGTWGPDKVGGWSRKIFAVEDMVVGGGERGREDLPERNFGTWRTPHPCPTDGIDVGRFC